MSAQQQEVITAAEAQAVASERVSLLATFAHRYGLEANNMMRTLRATVLRPSSNGVEPSNEQVASFLIVANQHGLNPFTKEVHGFVDKRGGIVPIVGVDGWAKKINEHEAFNGMKFVQDDTSCTCTIFRKDREHPTEVTEYLSECKRPNSEAWGSHPKRMLRHRAMVQCARLAFSFAGVVDPDEGEQVLAAVDAEIDVTPNKDGKLPPKKMKETVEGMLKAVSDQDAPALFKIYNELTNDQRLFVWDQLRSYEKTAIKALQKQPGYNVDLTSWSIEAIRTAKEPASLETSWKLIQDAFAELDSEVPGDVETCHIDRKAELGA